MTLHYRYYIAVILSLFGAILLWSVQPLIARILLPRFGGSAAVWTTSLVFFQMVLCLGYSVSDWLVRRARYPRASYALLMLVAVCTLPIGTTELRADQTPILTMLKALSITVGIPYLVLATTAPIVQATVAKDVGRETYRLYAWSNLGSFLGLLAYPFLFEPFMPVSNQVVVWSITFVIFIVGMSVLAKEGLKDFRRPENDPSQVNKAAGYGWFIHAAFGVGLLVSVSEAIMADLTVSPILWVIPLGVYLLTFVCVFGWSTRFQSGIWWWAWLGALGGIVYLQATGWSVHWAVQLSLWSLVLGIGCTVLHSELVSRQPPPDQLTRFYFYVSLGGMTGGIMVGAIAPILLPIRLEVEICALAITWLGWQQYTGRQKEKAPFASQDIARVLSLLVFCAAVLSMGYQAIKAVRGDTFLYRNFYGALKVKTYAIPKSRGGLRHLMDGRISHGFQYRGPTSRRLPTAYFTANTGIGRVLSPDAPPRHVGIMGLGVGTLASYCRQGDRYQFYELNPDVEHVAKAHFTYLSDAQGSVKTVLGDGRLELERQPPQGFNVLVIDAFTGDAIPAHLLTREAFAIYLKHLNPQGILAINVSNRHADLIRVVKGEAERSQLSISMVRHREKSPLGVYLSQWALIARSVTTLSAYGLTPLMREDIKSVEWTDDFAPLLQILR